MKPRSSTTIHTSANDDIMSLEISESEAALDPTGYDVMARQFATSAPATEPTDSQIAALDDHRAPHWWL
jgi:hypothetical protein